MRHTLSLILLLAAGLVAGCDPKSSSPAVPAPAASTEARPVAAPALADQSVADFRRQLLAVAFATATAIPLEPHIKDRCKAQESVVAACLQLEQAATALEYLEQIPDWRRGVSYADLPLHLVRSGQTKLVDHYLKQAELVANASGLEDWRRNAIRVRIAAAHVILGQLQRAGKFEAGIEQDQAGQVAQVKAMVLDDDSFEKELALLEGIMKSSQFDAMKNALLAYAQLFDSVYDDHLRRDRVEDMIKASWRPIPVVVRIEVLMRMVGFCLNRQDSAKAMSLVDEAQTMLDGNRWPVDYLIPLQAQLAGLRFKAGDGAKAKELLASAMAQYDSRREEIVNIYRAGVLRPIAESYQTMGDKSASLAIYARAVEEGMVNPNSRPRAEDLSATCRSMALLGVEPGDKLWIRIREIQSQLRDPW